MKILFKRTDNSVVHRDKFLKEKLSGTKLLPRTRQGLEQLVLNFLSNNRYSKKGNHNLPVTMSLIYQKSKKMRMRSK